VKRIAILAGALVLLLAACGGASTTKNGAARTALAFSRCMRTNGVPRYPDPGNSGQLVKESLLQLGVSGAQFQAAESACRRLLPNGGSPPSAAQVRQVRELSLQFSRCVRAHGLPDFPDPDSTGRIPDPASVGVDQGAPKFEAANSACGRYRPPYIPSDSAYEAWARTRGR
jgi:hypothetical protein